MLPNHDETIVCADCGEAFLFTAAEAAFYVQKNLAAPPKRCKACRAARKERAGEARGPTDARGARRPRTTGDVNEYRSPMQDGGWSPPRGATRGPRDGGPPPAHAPLTARASTSDGAASNPKPRVPGDREAALPDEQPGQTGSAGDRRAEPVAPKARAHGAMFDVTCCTCGAKTQVPFRPVEGRDVFCQPCYRARKPARTG